MSYIWYFHSLNITKRRVGTVIIVMIQSRKWGTRLKLITRNRAAFPAPDVASQIEKDSSRIT